MGQPKMMQGGDAGSIGTSIMGGSAEASKMSQGGPNKQYSDKVDLNDLDWEDRERVLRLLFSKMNAGVPTNATKIMAKQMMVSERTGAGAQQMLDYSADPAHNNYDE